MSGKEIDSISVDIILISPPWPLFNRPSIQTGALKAYLRKNLPGEIKVKNLHPYLFIAEALGFDKYNLISQSSWASEAVYAHLLFPGRKGPEELFYQGLDRKLRGDRGRVKPKEPDFFHVTQVCKRVIVDYIQGLDLSSCKMVGISVCLNQLFAGLFLARLIKSICADIPIVMGGASVSGHIGQGILQAFSQIDYVIDGEGERPLLKLARFLLGISQHIDSPAVLSREVKGHGGKEQLSDLGELPVPDYVDYFKELGQIKGASGIQVVLPVEASRGCWWGRCTFCNLNLQWQGYRAKEVGRIQAEIECLTRRYQIVDFAFMDNCLPRKTAASIFDAVASAGRDYSFFAEVRAVHSRDEYRRMKSGGLSDLQIGIEALCTDILKRLGKGSSAIKNLAAMKHCEEFGINLQANLITEFPGCTQEEVEETLKNLEFAWPFAPLKAVPFWLGNQSPVFFSPRDFGIRYIRPHRNYKRLLPKEYLSNWEPLILEYTGDKQRQRRLWRQVEKRLLFFHRQREKLKDIRPFLSYRDAREFILIRQVLPNGTVLRHKLNGPSRLLYLSCIEPVEIDRVCQVVPNIPKESILRFIMDLVNKRLMFKEGDLVLSLAIRSGCKTNGMTP